MKIEEYAVIGDMHTVALVGANGSIDWLCLPKFGSEACFASLLGMPDNGFWRIWPSAPDAAVARRYQGDTLVLETEYTTKDGRARVIDFMPTQSRERRVVRIVEGVAGHVDMIMKLIVRFDYGKTIPWVRHLDDCGLVAIAGPNAVTLHTAVPIRGEGLSTVASFTVSEGERKVVRPHLAPLARGAGGGPSHLRRPPRKHPALLGQLGRPVPVQGSLASRGRQVPHHPEGAHP